MKDNYARIAYILDRSGSMASMKDAAISGYNEFLQDQRAVPGEADIQLVLFSTQVESRPVTSVLGAVDLNEFNYAPNGGTALYDAVAQTIDEVGQELAEMAEDDRPSKVIFCIFTDGEENSSKEYMGEDGRQRLAEKIKHQREVYGWEFIFMAANMDAKAVAMSMSMAAASAMNFDPTPEGLTTSNAANSRMVSSFRTGH